MHFSTDKLHILAEQILFRFGADKLFVLPNQTQWSTCARNGLRLSLRNLCNKVMAFFD